MTSVIEALNKFGIEYLPLNNVDVKRLESINAYILNYQQVETHRHAELSRKSLVVRESRSLVVRQLPDKSWTILSRSFDRFFNYGEDEEETKQMVEAFAQKQAVAYEKKDGSLITMSYFDDAWHVFTRNSDADANPLAFHGKISLAEAPSETRTYGQVIRSLVNEKLLNPKYTYIFEWCMENSHITRYDMDHLTLLTIFDADRTELSDDEQYAISKEQNWFVPEKFVPTSYEHVMQMCATKPNDFEGYVIKAGTLRLKAKTDLYKSLHHLGRTRALINIDDLIQVVIKGELEELKTISYMKKHLETLDAISAVYIKAVAATQLVCEKYGHLSPKEFAAQVAANPMCIKWLAFNVKAGKNTFDDLKSADTLESIMPKLITSIKYLLQVQP